MGKIIEIVVLYYELSTFCFFENSKKLPKIEWNNLKFYLWNGKKSLGNFSRVKEPNRKKEEMLQLKEKVVKQEFFSPENTWKKNF